MDARGQHDAEEAFMNTMRDYFHNLSASRKRKHADAIALAFATSAVNSTSCGTT